MVKSLVTGGAGFIGSHISGTLLKKGHEVRVIDNVSTGNLDNLKDIEDKVELVNGSITDKELLGEAVKDVNYIFHEAALTSVAESIQNPKKTWEINITGTKLLLEAAVRNKVKKFMFTSSAAVYGVAEPPLNESMNVKSISPYGDSKRMGEILCENYFKKHKLETVSLRCFNVYGPRQNPKSEYSGVISKFIDAALEGRNPTIYGDGNQTRDFICVEDVVKANFLAMEKKHAPGSIFNIATGTQTSINDLAKIIYELSGTDFNPVYEEPRKGDIKHSYADISKAKKYLGFEPEYSLKEGLKKTIEWYKENR